MTSQRRMLKVVRALEGQRLHRVRQALSKHRDGLPR